MSPLSALHLSHSSRGSRVNASHCLVVSESDERPRTRRAAPALKQRMVAASASSSDDDQAFRPKQHHPPLSEIRVCTNKACRRQGSEAIAKLASDLNLPGIEVVKSGCLGVCGAGPNVAFLPQEIIASHVATPARFLSALEAVAGVVVSPALMRATTLRLQGNALARKGDLKGAERVYSMALEGGGEGGRGGEGGGGEGGGGGSERALSGSNASSPSSSSSEPAPEGSRHLLLSNRSGVRLALGDARGALEDAEKAVAEGPPKWATALVRLAEARAASGDSQGAADALRAAKEADPSMEEAVTSRTRRKRR